jgi:hypothetical protein
MPIQTIIDAKLEALNDATQARVDATQAEARAAVDVIVTSVQSACPGVRYIEFDRDEVTGAVGFSRIYGTSGDCEPSEASQGFWHRTAGLIAADEFLTSDVDGLSLAHAADHEWILDIKAYRTSSGN